MKIEYREVKKFCNTVVLFYLTIIGAFLLIAHDQIVKTAPNIVETGKGQTSFLEELVDGMEVYQKIDIQNELIDSIAVKFGTFERKNSGVINAYLINKTTGECIRTKKLNVCDIQNGRRCVLFKNLVFNPKDMGEYYLELTSEGCSSGNAVALSADDKSTDAPVIINGGERNTTSLYVQVTGRNYNVHFYWYYLGAAAGLIILCGYAFGICYKYKKGKMTNAAKYICIVLEYSFLMKQLVARDFNVKYKKSLLGVTWSLLNPLLTMTVQFLVFNNIFRFQIENYAVYLLTGIVFYNAMTETTTSGLYSIVGNASLITKVYVPKYIYPVSKVLSASINTVISFIPLLLVTLITGLKLTPAILLLPICLLLQIIFEIGLSMLLSSAMVFFRDVQFLWSVFTMLWMYLTPVIYSIEQLPENIRRFIVYNPMYHYVTFARTIIIDGASPMPIQYAICMGFSALFLVGGTLVFKRTQDKFILYI